MIKVIIDYAPREEKTLPSAQVAIYTSCGLANFSSVVRIIFFTIVKSIFYTIIVIQFVQQRIRI